MIIFCSFPTLRQKCYVRYIESKEKIRNSEKTCYEQAESQISGKLNWICTIKYLFPTFQIIFIIRNKLKGYGISHQTINVFLDYKRVNHKISNLCTVNHQGTGNSSNNASTNFSLHFTSKRSQACVCTYSMYKQTTVWPTYLLSLVKELPSHFLSKNDSSLTQICSSLFGHWSCSVNFSPARVASSRYVA